MAGCAQSAPHMSPSLVEDDLYPKMLVMISQKIDHFLTNFENHYILAFQESLLNVSANFKILSDALALDEEGISLCNVKNVARRKERLSLAGQVQQILEKFRSPMGKTVSGDAGLRVSTFQISDKKNEEREPPPTPTLKEEAGKIFEFKDPIKRDSEREVPRNQDNTLFLGGEYAHGDRSKNNFSFFLPSINTSHMSSQYLNKSDREEGPQEVVEFKGVSQIVRSRSPVAKAIEKVQEKYRSSRSHSSDRAREKKQKKRSLGETHGAATMSTDSLLKKQKFHSFIYTAKKLQKDEEKMADKRHSESTEYGDYTVNIIQEGTRNKTVALEPESRHSFHGSKTLKQAQKMRDFLSTVGSQNKESTFKQKRASMPEQEFQDKMGLGLAPRNVSPKPAESPVKLKLIEMESPPSPKSRRESQRVKQPATEKKMPPMKLKPSLDLTPRSQKGKVAQKRGPLSSHRLQTKPYEKELTQWNSSQRQKSKLYSRQGSKQSTTTDRAVKRKSSLGRMTRYPEEEKIRTPGRKESSKSAILVERRDRSASPPSKMNEQSKKFSKVMEPHVVRQIAELQGHFIPPIAFVNREVVQNFLKYREHECQVQCTLFEKKIHSARDELDMILQRKKFTLSKDSARELRSMNQQSQWAKLLAALEEDLVGNKDVVILRLFFTFLGKSFSGKNQTFIKQVTKYLWEVKPSFEYKLHPESHFVFTENVKKKVKELLISSTEEKYSSVETSKLAIFDVLTNILIEAMQFSTLIPHRVETEIESMQQAKKEAKETLKLVERLRLKLRA